MGGRRRRQVQVAVGVAAVLGFVCWCIAAGRVAEGALEGAPVFVVRDDDDGYRKRWKLFPENSQVNDL